MKTRLPEATAFSPGNVSAPPPAQGSRGMPVRTAQGRALPINPGAVEYASWLRLLRRPAP